MSFEDSILQKIDRERPRRQRESVRTPTFERAFQRAHQVLQDPRFSIQAPSFMNLYGEENVMADMVRVMKKRQSFASNSSEENESKMVADVFEAIVLQQSAEGGWLGNHASALKTSLYDDYFNGTDMLAEWERPEEESQVLGLSVDITFSAKGIEQKIEHLKKNVESGKLGTVKYFRNKDGSFRGERNGIPQVVVGVDANTVFKLADLWIKGEQTALQNHGAQRLLIDEMVYQMETIEQYAMSKGQKKLAHVYSRSLPVIRKLQQQKRHIPHAEFGEDRVYKAILERVAQNFGTGKREIPN